MLLLFLLLPLTLVNAYKPASTIHIFPNFLTKSTCSKLIKRCESLTTFETLNSNHVNFQTPDVSLLDYPDVMEEFEKEFRSVYDRAREAYDIPIKPYDEFDDGRLGIEGIPEFGSEFVVEPYSSSPLSFLDLFVVKYSSSYPELLPHRDGSLISFTIPLSDVHKGGGTMFNNLDNDDRILTYGDKAWGEINGNVVKGNKGNLILHSGKMKHAGSPITEGERFVLVGFINVDCKNKGLFEACKNYGRWDGLEKRLKDLKGTGRKLSRSRKWGNFKEGGMRGGEFTYNVDRIRKGIEGRLKDAEKGRNETERFFLEECNGGLEFD
ncbi:hypothetical protein TL16_g03951 [Triparma laevis f. inornata]|uniref:Fe2OG dioxygenase domain-containing protein n=2 Tax=Triparma laevis TaxID=1534972 RepID=A0A9W6ZJF7_9STRA|nr:hypothetical protein TrLO_g4481 [Triparma laevis f. longispina]GMH64386.1 hypothetical protein TL16_g03951 [Triparma laevis f. inornata]